jgi:poly-gamma-glutamate synthesis protein (capsule biosynthesis protein)
VAELASSWVATARRPGEANAINLGQTLAAVRAAKQRARVVIVFVHWGTEGMACPDPNQLSLAPKLAAAGASIIIGSHAHMLQGSGWLGHTFVAYGMANFLWWENSYSTATGVLKLTLRPHAPLTARFIPAVVSGTGQPVVDHGAAARRALAHYTSLRPPRAGPLHELANLRWAVREPTHRGEHADIGRLASAPRRFCRGGRDWKPRPSGIGGLGG